MPSRPHSTCAWFSTSVFWMFLSVATFSCFTVVFTTGELQRCCKVLHLWFGTFLQLWFQPLFTCGLKGFAPVVWNVSHLWFGTFKPSVWNVLPLWFERLCTCGLKSFAPVAWNVLHLWFGTFAPLVWNVFAAVVSTVVHMWFVRICTCGLKRFTPVVWNF